MRKMRMFLVVAAVMGLVGGGVAWSTPGTTGITAVTMARGTLGPHFKIKLHDSSKPADAVVQHVTIPAGGYTGWHTHPGPAIVIVQSGELTVYEADDASCAGTVYVRGQILLDEGYGNIHIGHNAGTTPLELWITFLDVPPGTSPRIDAASPGNCPF